MSNCWLLEILPWLPAVLLLKAVPIPMPKIITPAIRAMVAMLNFKPAKPSPGFLPASPA